MIWGQSYSRKKHNKMTKEEADVQLEALTGILNEIDSGKYTDVQIVKTFKQAANGKYADFIELVLLWSLYRVAKRHWGDNYMEFITEVIKEKQDLGTKLVSEIFKGS